jgi:hypothetical protein
VTTELLIVRLSSHIRATSEAEILTALEEASHELPRQVVSVDLTPYEAEVEGGHWEASHAFVRKVAGDLRAAADKLKDVRIVVGGIAEIPHVVALGAYFSDERQVEVRDLDRDRGTWAWPEQRGTLQLETVNLPTERVPQSGAVVLRLEVSNAIGDAEVRSEVGDDYSANVSIRLAGAYPIRGAVRSSQDVETVKIAVRRTLAALEDLRPNATVIHLFIAAPVSVSFVVGQELHLRSGTPVQTYRHRVRDGENPYSPAILLSASTLSDVESPLSPEQEARADHIRTMLWPRTLDDVIRYSAGHRFNRPTATPPKVHYPNPLRSAFQALKGLVDRTRPRQSVGQGRWYNGLATEGLLLPIDPFPGLLPIGELVAERDQVDPEPQLGDYGFDKDGKDGRVWRLPDRLLVGLDQTVNGDDASLKRLIRLFLFHEYLHDWQDLTKYTAGDVGSYANSLERIDYLADTYAILHEHDYTLKGQPEAFAQEWQRKDLLADLIDLVIRSFWTFQPSPPQYVWQERRLRRYLNWFWRRVQVRRASSLQVALKVLTQPPAIEVAGLEYRVGRGRVFVALDRLRPGENLEIGLVLEDGRFFRTASVGNMSIEALLKAFVNHDHDGVSLFFNSLFENVRATQGHLPVGAGATRG